MERLVGHQLFGSALLVLVIAAVLFFIARAL